MEFPTQGNSAMKVDPPETPETPEISATPESREGPDTGDGDERSDEDRAAVEQRREQLRRKYLGPTERNAGSLVGAGVELAAGVGVMSLGGWWLDQRLGTSPWLLVTGLSIALVGGLYRMYRAGMQMFRDDERSS